MRLHVNRRLVLRSLAAAPVVLPFAFGRAVAHNGINHNPQMHDVGIKGFAFDPAVLAVKPGDTVRWTNLDIAPHTATATDRSWDTGMVAGGDSAEITISAEMSVDYVCRFHPMMKGRLEIGELD